MSAVNSSENRTNGNVTVIDDASDLLDILDEDAYEEMLKKFLKRHDFFDMVADEIQNQFASSTSPSALSPSASTSPSEFDIANEKPSDIFREPEAGDTLFFPYQALRALKGQDIFLDFALDVFSNTATSLSIVENAVGMAKEGDRASYKGLTNDLAGLGLGALGIPDIITGGFLASDLAELHTRATYDQYRVIDIPESAENLNEAVSGMGEPQIRSWVEENSRIVKNPNADPQPFVIQEIYEAGMRGSERNAQSRNARQNGTRERMSYGSQNREGRSDLRPDAAEELGKFAKSVASISGSAYDAAIAGAAGNAQRRNDRQNGTLERTSYGNQNREGRSNLRQGTAEEFGKFTKTVSGWFGDLWHDVSTFIVPEPVYSASEPEKNPLAASRLPGKNQAGSASGMISSSYDAFTERRQQTVEQNNAREIIRFQRSGRDSGMDWPGNEVGTRASAELNQVMDSMIDWFTNMNDQISSFLMPDLTPGTPKSATDNKGSTPDQKQKRSRENDEFINSLHDSLRDRQSDDPRDTQKYMKDILSGISIPIADRFSDIVNAIMPDFTVRGNFAAGAGGFFKGARSGFSSSEILDDDNVYLADDIHEETHQTPITQTPVTPKSSVKQKKAAADNRVGQIKENSADKEKANTERNKQSVPKEKRELSTNLLQTRQKAESGVKTASPAFSSLTDGLSIPKGDHTTVLNQFTDPVFDWIDNMGKEVSSFIFPETVYGASESELDSQAAVSNRQNEGAGSFVGPLPDNRTESEINSVVIIPTESAARQETFNSLWDEQPVAKKEHNAALEKAYRKIVGVSEEAGPLIDMANLDPAIFSSTLPFMSQGEWFGTPAGTFFDGLNLVGTGLSAVDNFKTAAASDDPREKEKYNLMSTTKVVTTVAGGLLGATVGNPVGGASLGASAGNLIAEPFSTFMTDGIYDGTFAEWATNYVNTREEKEREREESLERMAWLTEEVPISKELQAAAKDRLKQEALERAQERAPERIRIRDEKEVESAARREAFNPLWDENSIAKEDHRAALADAEEKYLDFAAKADPYLFSAGMAFKGTPAGVAADMLSTGNTLLQGSADYKASQNTEEAREAELLKAKAAITFAGLGVGTLASAPATGTTIGGALAEPLGTYMVDSIYDGTFKEWSDNRNRDRAEKEREYVSRRNDFNSLVDEQPISKEARGAGIARIKQEAMENIQENAWNRIRGRNQKEAEMAEMQNTFNPLWDEQPISREARSAGIARLKRETTENIQENALSRIFGRSQKEAEIADMKNTFNPLWNEQPISKEDHNAVLEKTYQKLSNAVNEVAASANMVNIDPAIFPNTLPHMSAGAVRGTPAATVFDVINLAGTGLSVVDNFKTAAQSDNTRDKDKYALMGMTKLATTGLGGYVGYHAGDMVAGASIGAAVGNVIADPLSTFMADGVDDGTFAAWGKDFISGRQAKEAELEFRKESFNPLADEKPIAKEDHSVAIGGIMESVFDWFGKIGQEFSANVFGEAGAGPAAEGGAEIQLDGLTEMLAGFQEVANTFGENSILKMEMVDEELQLTWDESLISELEIGDQIAEISGVMEEVASLINELNQEGLADLAFDDMGLEIDLEGFQAAAEEVQLQFTTAYEQVAETWSGLASLLRSNEWQPMEADITSVESKIKGATRQVDQFASRLDAQSGRVVEITFKTNGIIPSVLLAQGGILTSPHVALIGEAGPESVIPLSSARRARGIALWEETGAILGVLPEGDAGEQTENGLYAGISAQAGAITSFEQALHTQNVIPFPALSGRRGNSSAPWYAEDGDEEPGLLAGISISPKASGQTEGQPQSGVAVQVSVTSNPEYVIQAGDGVDAEDVLSVIRSHSRELAKELADDIGGELAERLEMVYENVPLKGVS